MRYQHGICSGNPALIAIAMCIVSLTSALAASASPGSVIPPDPELPEVTWFKAESDLDAKEYVEIKCGSLGSYYFGAGRIGVCPVPVKGASCRVDQLAYYSQEVIDFSYSSGLFDEPGPEPSVALVDWFNGHGAAMATTIKELSDWNVILYDLGTGSTLNLGLSGATDVHVIKALCELVEDTERMATQSYVFNMSWGRPADDGIYNACSKVEAANRPGGEVSLIIEHLTGLAVGNSGNTMAAVAAAGNHHDPSQFPACLEKVLSVAAPDSAKLATRRLVEVSWESPSTYNALAPGTGLCFNGHEESLVIPNGSSASSAFFSALLAQALHSSYIPDPTDGLWYPDPYFPYYLIHARSPVVGVPVGSIEKSFYAIEPPTYHELMDRLLGETSETCLPTNFAHQVPATNIIPLELDFGAELLPELSLPEAFVDEWLPSPTTMPCGACPSLPSGGGGVKEAIPISELLVIDLTTGMKLSDLLELKAVYLRIGDSFMGPLRQDQTLLRDLSDGNLKYIAFDHFNPINYWDSVSLIMILTCPSCADPNTEFWSATPVRVLPVKY